MEHGVYFALKFLVYYIPMVIAAVLFSALLVVGVDVYVVNREVGRKND